MVTPHLTHLDLGGNGFIQIPSAIGGLTGLEVLRLSDCPLQLLRPSRMVLKSLPELRVLDMRKEGDCGSHIPCYSHQPASLAAMRAQESALVKWIAGVRRYFPDLDVLES